ncbi:GNAT family N-acetyltransferase [Teredinibacter haidensis]|uniref:GNAT family N-acetyltransferase n=1 Tax=Teredinibacter haidensis TaxID=2731755 RepID=UPI000948F94C|nr:GNAT family N-acetyltransferase [Teredinibacter haidensis]
MQEKRLTIYKVETSSDIQLVEKLAQEIWREYFIPIIGAAQVDYMLDKFQSVDAISAQIASGGDYYLAQLEGEAVGYTGLVPDRDRKKLMVSKIYIRQSVRGKGIGRSFFDFAVSSCKAGQLDSVWLTVNRYNTRSVAWYQKLGFIVVDEKKKNIGGGFFMDDYIMEKRL